MHTVKADVERIYLLHPKSGRGLINLEKEYKKTMVTSSEYMAHNVEV